MPWTSCKIIGAADSKTGTPKHNRALSVKRAKYIAKLLMKAGVDKSKMQGMIEIKSGKDYKRHNALSNVMHNEEYAIPRAIVFSNGNVQIVDNYLLDTSCCS